MGKYFDLAKEWKKFEVTIVSLLLEHLESCKGVGRIETAKN